MPLPSLKFHLIQPPADGQEVEYEFHRRSNSHEYYKAKNLNSPKVPGLSKVEFDWRAEAERIGRGSTTEVVQKYGNQIVKLADWVLAEDMDAISGSRAKTIALAKQMDVLYLCQAKLTSRSKVFPTARKILKRRFEAEGGKVCRWLIRKLDHGRDSDTSDWSSGSSESESESTGVLLTESELESESECEDPVVAAEDDGSDSGSVGSEGAPLMNHIRWNSE